MDDLADLVGRSDFGSAKQAALFNANPDSFQIPDPKSMANNSFSPSLHLSEKPNGACAKYVIIHTFLPPSHFVDRAGWQAKLNKWLPLEFGYHDIMCTSAIRCYPTLTANFSPCLPGRSSPSIQRSVRSTCALSTVCATSSCLQPASRLPVWLRDHSPVISNVSVHQPHSGGGPTSRLHGPGCCCSLLLLAAGSHCNDQIVRGKREIKKLHQDKDSFSSPI